VRRSDQGPAQNDDVQELAIGDGRDREDPHRQKTEEASQLGRDPRFQEGDNAVLDLFAKHKVRLQMLRLLLGN